MDTASSEPAGEAELGQTVGSPSLVPGQRELLDVISQAKEVGFEADIDMPEIAVFGDQSSGKSSVLEAITKVSFLISDSLCTRFPIEFVMRHAPDELDWSATIIPHHGRSRQEMEQLRQFVPPDVSIKELGKITQAAAVAMGLDGVGENNFSHDVLQVTISGSEVPNLTLIDLPGIFHGRGPGQTEEDAVQVEALVRSYMIKPRTIILAIISADRDLAAQIVTKWAQEADPSGKRTMGIITKPDMLDEYPTRAKEYLEVARNNVIQFQLGWHVLKNKKCSEAGLSLSQRDQVEGRFLATGLWAQLPISQKGIGELMKRLSHLLHMHIVSESISMVTAFKVSVDGLNQQLAELELASTANDVKVELGQLAADFTQLARDAVAGSYSHTLFRTSALRGQRHLELRRVVEELIVHYARSMLDSGHSYEVVEHDAVADKTQHDAHLTSHPCVSNHLDRSELMSLVSQRLDMTPRVAGQFDAGLASDLFYEQSQPWASVTKKLSADIGQAVEKFIIDTIKSLAPANMVQAVWDHVIHPNCRRLSTQLELSVDYAMKMYTDHRPVVFDKSITDQIPLARQYEIRRILAERIPPLLQPGGLLRRDYPQPTKTQVSTLSEKILQELTVDFPSERLTSAEIIHCAQMYYKASLPRMLAKFDLSSFDDWILSKLPEVFSPSTVQSLTESQLDTINSGGAGRHVERDMLHEKRLKLLKILDLLTKIAYGNGAQEEQLSGRDRPLKRSRIG